MKLIYNRTSFQHATMSKLIEFVNEQNNRQQLLGLLQQPSAGSGNLYSKILLGKIRPGSAWADELIPFFTVSDPGGNHSEVRVTNDKGVRSRDWGRIFDTALAQQAKYPNLSRRSVDQTVNDVFKLAMGWEKEVSSEQAPAEQPQEPKMMVVPVVGLALHRRVPKELRSRIKYDEVYHVTLAYRPKELGIGLGQLEVIGYAEAEDGKYAWLTVRFRRQLPDGDYGPWELKNADGGNLHITLKAPPGKAGQIGKMSPTKTEEFSSEAFPVIWCPVAKKRMDKGLTADHLQLFFDLDGTLITVDRDKVDPRLIKGYNYLRDARTLAEVSEPTPLLRALINSLSIVVVTSRRLIKGQGATQKEMEDAFWKMLVRHGLVDQDQECLFKLSFLAKKIVTYGTGDREVHKGVEKASRVIGLSESGAIPVHIDDSQGTIVGVISSGQVIGCHYNQHTFGFKMEQPKVQNLPNHLVMGFQGMPGSGKSTILNKVAALLREAGRPTEVFSTDQIQADGFLGPDTYRELESRIKQALGQHKTVLVDTCLAGKGVNSRAKRPAFLSRVVSWDTWGFDSLFFMHCLESVITRRGHRLAIPGTRELLLGGEAVGEAGEEQLPDAMVLGEGPIRMEDNGPGLIEMTGKLKTIRDLQDYILWMGIRNHTVKTRFLDRRPIEAYALDDHIPETTITTTEYVSERKNLVDAWGREARGVSDVFSKGRFRRFKATFSIGPETGPNSTEKGRPRDAGYRDIAGRVEAGKEFREEAHLSLKEDGECYGLSLNSGDVAKALQPWFDLTGSNITPELERGRDMLKVLSRLVPGAVLTISTRGTPGLGLTNTEISLTAHVKSLYGFLAAVSQEMGVDPASITLDHAFKLAIAHLKIQVIPMLQEVLTSAELGERGITGVMEVHQARRRCQFKDYTGSLQTKLAVEYPQAGYSFIGFNWHSSPVSVRGGTESGLYSFAPASTQADLLDKYGLSYAAFTVTHRPDLVIREFEEVMRADEALFKDKLTAFKSQFRGRFGFHPEGLVMMIRLLPPEGDQISTNWVYLKLKPKGYYLVHAKNPNMAKVAKIPKHHGEWFPLVRFKYLIDTADFQQIHREVRWAARLVMLYVESNKTHPHHQFVKQLMAQKGTRAAFEALINQPGVKYTKGELHHVVASTLVLSPQLSQLVKNHPMVEIGGGLLDPLWGVVHRLVKFFGSEPFPHEVEDQLLPMSYDGLMARAEHVKMRHLAGDVAMLFGK